MAPLESVESLGKIVVNESRDKAEWNVKSAQETSKKILEEAAQKAKENYDRIVQQGKQSGEKERQKILSTVEMEMKKLTLNSREALIEQAFDLAWKKFEDFEKTKDYKDILIKQVIASIRELTGKAFIVDVHKGDPLTIGGDTLKQIEKETNKKGIVIEIRQVDRDLGGVIVHEKNGKIAVDNTFASILERKKNDTRVKVSEVLFE
jgi:vacuolar-type H+-ATPase subunit E/Vma4